MEFSLCDCLLLVKLEVSAKCNSKCIMCYSDVFLKDRDKIGMMDFSLFKKVVDELEKEMGKINIKKRLQLIEKVEKHIKILEEQNIRVASREEIKKLKEGKLLIRLWGRGEPFLNPGMLDMIKYLKGKQFYVELSSNCSLLNKDLIDKILESEAVDEINISCESHIKEVYEKIRVGLNYDTILKNIECLIEGVNKFRNSIRVPSLNVYIVKLKENSPTIDATVDFFKKKGLSVCIEEDVRYRKRNNSLVCPMLNNGVMVCADWRVAKCSFQSEESLYLGNLKKEPLKEIWLGKKNLKFLYLNNARKLASLSTCKRFCVC